MPGPCTWTASKSRTGNTELIRLFRGERRLSFEELFGLLQDDADFAAWYTDLLLGSPFAAFFWEHPPLTVTNIEGEAEFVTVDAPMLAGLQPDVKPFRNYFAGDDVVTFQNLGGDATLVVPSPAAARPGYAHLGAFLQNAPDHQVISMWQWVGRAVCRTLSAAPLWLSTSGLGVAWLHVRLDSTPKYYQHVPYKSAAPAAESPWY